MATWDIHQKDVIEALRTFPDNYFDGMLTDPPYGLSDHPDMLEVLGAWLRGEAYVHGSTGFMGKEWDAFVPGPEVWKEVLRVLKPGASAFVFAGDRTQDLMGLALRLAGFELRGTVAWLYGSGFPKSMNLGKAVDQHLGAERPVVGEREHAPKFTGAGNGGFNDRVGENGQPATFPVTAPATDEAAAWEGHGTALKPGYEPVILVQKPLDGTYAANAMAWGVAGLNIDGGRIQFAGSSDERKAKAKNQHADFESGPRAGMVYGQDNRDRGNWNPSGRWPANVMLDEEAALELDAQSGESVSRQGKRRKGAQGTGWGMSATGAEYSDRGGASRFFYVAKASRSERDAGLDAFPVATGGEMTDRKEGSAGLNNPRAGAGRTSGGRNTHPTVKPMALARHLATLLLPPGRPGEPRRILVPFSGSGTEMIGALLAGWDELVGIEREEQFVAYTEARLRHWAGAPPVVEVPIPVGQLCIFSPADLAGGVA